MIKMELSRFLASHSQMHMVLMAMAFTHLSSERSLIQMVTLMSLIYQGIGPSECLHQFWEFLISMASLLECEAKWKRQVLHTLFTASSQMTTRIHTTPESLPTCQIKAATLSQCMKQVRTTLPMRQFSRAATLHIYRRAYIRGLNHTPSVRCKSTQPSDLNKISR